MAHNVVHFAIHADDVERARRFYEAVSGWRFEAWRPPVFYHVLTGDDQHPGIPAATAYVARAAALLGSVNTHTSVHPRSRASATKPSTNALPVPRRRALSATSSA